MTKKLCTKCKRMLDSSKFYKSKTKNNLYSWCKECMCEYQKERHMELKRKTMNAYGGRCVYVNKNGVQCIKNAKDNLDELQLSHPNNDGNAHRDLISNGEKGFSFYNALYKRNWNTDGYVVEVRCISHHRMLDRSKEGKFNDPDWLRRKYATMSLREVARECGVGHILIRSRLIAFGIPRRKPGSRV